MDPIVEKPKKSKKKLFIGVGVILALLLIGGGYGYWWMKTEPERSFYDAISNSMQTSYVSRKITGSGMTVNATSDFSNVNSPVTQLAYETEVGSAQDEVVKGEQIALDANYVIARYTRTPSGSLDKPYVLNKWYKVSTKGRDNFFGYSFMKYVNSPFAVVPQGNFRTNNYNVQMLNDLKNGKVYDITGVNYKSNTTIYSVRISDSAMHNFIDKSLGLIGNGGSVPIYPTFDNAAVSISINDGRISKIVIGGSSSANKSGTVIEFKYPSSVNIVEPQDVGFADVQ